MFICLKNVALFLTFSICLGVIHIISQQFSLTRWPLPRPFPIALFFFTSAKLFRQVKLKTQNLPTQYSMAKIAPFTVAGLLRAGLEIFLLHQNPSFCTVTFGEKVLTLEKLWLLSAQLRYIYCWEVNITIVAVKCFYLKWDGWPNDDIWWQGGWVGVAKCWREQKIYKEKNFVCVRRKKSWNFLKKTFFDAVTFLWAF